MKKSVDLIHDGHFQKAFLNSKPNNEEQETENENYTSLSRVYTLSLLKDSQGNPISINEPNAAISKRKKAELFHKYNKTEDDSKLIVKNTKNTWVKKVKIDKPINNFKKSHFVRKFIDDNSEKSISNISKENNGPERQKEIEEIKDSVICYICLMKVTSPKMCPNCHRIACEKCLRSWFITKNNKSCGYCRAVMTFDKMISVPIINNVANLIEKISIKNHNSNKRLKNRNGKKNKLYFSKISEKDENDYNNNTNDLNEETNLDDNLNYYTKISKVTSGRKKQIYFSKKSSLLSRSTHTPYIYLKEEKEQENSDNETDDYCKKHPDQPLYYYCVNCDKAYCRTCFVFFGDEKDKHNNHKILEYGKYKKNNKNINIIPDIIKNSDKLDDIYEELSAYIKRCEALKECYEFEKRSFETQIKNLVSFFNNKMDENIELLNNTIKTYKNYLMEIEKCQNDVQKYYNNKMTNYKKNIFEKNLIEQLENIQNIKYLNSKEIDSYSDLSSKISLKTFQSKLKKYEIKQNSFHFKTTLENSIYQLAITQKGNEVQIYIYYPEENKTTDKKNEVIFPFVFLRRKNKNWESFQLSETLTYKGNCYFIKRFIANNFCTINSYFKIKGILYEISAE